MGSASDLPPASLKYPSCDACGGNEPAVYRIEFRAARGSGLPSVVRYACQRHAEEADGAVGGN